MGYVLGLDLGTSSLKGIIVDRDNRIIAQETSTYTFASPKTGYCEQEPSDWVNALNHVMRRLKEDIKDLDNQLEALSISGQMHGLVILDENNEVLRPAILWNDTRTTQQCRLLEGDLGEELLLITKNRPLEGFTLPKILWVQEHEPEIWKRVAHIMLPKDYLVWYLTGRYATDFSDAAGTLLLDLNSRDWSKKLLKLYQIDQGVLPKLFDSSDFVGIVKENLLKKWGLHTIVKVAAGGADNACAAIGAGIISKDISMVSIGTSGVVLSYEEKVHDNYKGMLHLFSHALKNGYYSMGVTLSAGYSLEWFRKTFRPDSNYDVLLKNVGKIKNGCEGLLFTPYIVGERTPYADSKIRGSFIGIDTNHTIDHFTRAVIEGITFSLKDSLVLMENISGKAIDKIVSVGGGAKSKEWLQIQADIFNSEILQLESEQGPGIGAAYLAMCVAGWYKELEDCILENVKYKDSYFPNENAVKEYEQIYQKYKKIYNATKAVIH